MTGTRCRASDRLGSLIDVLRLEDAGALVGRADGCAQAGEEFAAGADPLVEPTVPDRSAARAASSSSATCSVKEPASASSGDQVAVAHPGQRPAAAASGVRWMAAGTLPEAPDMRPSVTSATRWPRSCSTPSSGRELVQLGHAVGARALEAHDGHEVAVQRAGLEGGEEVAPGRRRPRPAPRPCRCSGLTAEVLITARPRLPSSILQAAVGGERVVGAAQHVGVVAALGARLPDQPVARQLSGSVV